MKKIIPSTTYGRVTLAAVWLQAIAIIALEAVVYGLFNNDNSDVVNDGTQRRGVPIYLIIFILSQVFIIYFAWDALVHKNTIQTIGFVIFNYCVFAYSVFQYFQITNIDGIHSLNQIKIPLIMIPSVSGAFSLLFSFLAFKLYLEFGWKIYKKIGADPKMREMYRWYQIFLMMLKLDLFFFIAFCAQFLYLVLQQNDPEYALTIAALPIAVIIIVLAVYGLKREDKLIMIVFMFGLLLAIAYFIFKLVRIQQPDQARKYVDSKRYLTFFSILTLLCVFITLVISIICYRNFGKGLKAHLMKSSSKSHTNVDLEERIPFEE